METRFKYFNNVSFAYEYDLKTKEVVYSMAFRRNGDNFNRKEVRNTLRKKMADGKVSKVTLLPNNPNYSIPRQDLMEYEIVRDAIKNPPSYISISVSRKYNRYFL